MSWDAVIFDFEDTLVDISRGKSPRSGSVYYSGAKGVPPVLDRAGRPVVEALALLTEAGIPVAVVTSSPEAAMRRWFQEHQFALPVAIIGFHDTVLHRPSPHPLLEVLAQLGLPASERVLSVGDSADDINAARRAGVTAATVRDFVPAGSPPDLFLPYVDSFFDDEQCYSLSGDLGCFGPTVSLQMDLPGHDCRVGGAMTEQPSNRLTNLLGVARDGNWTPELIDLAKTLVRHAAGSEDEEVVLTWVPAHQGRPECLKKLMVKLKEETQMTVSPLLRFRAEPGQQVSRDRAARESSMAGTMEARGKVDLSGRTIIVLDDYRCTGATLAEAARALKEAGASRVVGVALAQESHRSEEPRATYGPLTALSVSPEATRVESEADFEGKTAESSESPVQGGSTKPLSRPQQPAQREARAVEPLRQVVRPRRAPMPGTRMRVNAGQLEQTESPSSIKQRYPRAYQRWTAEEDALLARLCRQGKDLPTMCAALGRQLKSVETRIRRIEADINESDFLEGGSEGVVEGGRASSAAPNAITGSAETEPVDDEQELGTS